MHSRPLGHLATFRIGSLMELSSLAEVLLLVVTRLASAVGVFILSTLVLGISQVSEVSLL